MNATLRTIAMLLVIWIGSGCAGKLRSTDNELDEPDAGEVEGEKSGKFTTRTESDGSSSTLVDATEEEEWQQLDLDTGKAATAERDWDIAFSRFFIKTNGGVTGPGEVQVAALPGQKFAELERAPEEGFAPDREDSADDTDTHADNVFNSGDEDWYDYNVNRHELKPKDITYVIASSESRFYKFRIEDYYDSAGTPAKMRFRWLEIEGPESGWPPSGESGEP